MVRLLLSLASGLVLVLSYFWLAGVPVSSPPKKPSWFLAIRRSRDASDASAEVSVFMLKVVAPGNASASDLTLDRSILDGWAGPRQRLRGAVARRAAHARRACPILRGACVRPGRRPA
jgi:hypothetical protein